MSRLLQAIDKAYIGQEDKIALVFGDKRYSYTDLNENSEALAESLAVAGVAANHKIATILPNNAEFVLLMLAVAKLHATLVPLSLGITEKSLLNACQATGVDHLIVWHARHSDLAGSPCRFPVKQWFTAHEGGFKFLNSTTTTTNRQTAPRPSTLPDTEPYILTMTSGSTGAPKPIALSQATKLLRAQAVISLYDVSNQDTTLIATPLYHSLAERLLFVSLVSGGTAVLLPKFTLKSWLEAVNTHGVSFTIAVSSQLKQLAAALEGRNLSLPHMRCLVSSSALLDHEVKCSIIEHLDCDFHECYGASEIAIATNVKFDQVARTGSIGNAVPGTEIIILNEQDAVLPHGEPGEIACRTASVFSGYYDNSSLTEQAFTNDLFFKTGDIGRLDRKGNLYFLGRKKDLIITGGINVYPIDIETVVKQLPFVKECAAFALPDNHFGEVVALAVVASNKESFNVQSIKVKCATELDAYQQPRKYFQFDTLPQNTMGKLDKFKLVQLAQTTSANDQS